MHFTLKPSGDSAFLAELEQIRNLHVQKAADYGTAEDPLANIKMTEAFGLPSWIGVAIRMQDKMARLHSAVKQYLDTGKVTMANESLRDAFADMASYSIIGTVEVDRWAGPVPKNPICPSCGLHEAVTMRLEGRICVVCAEKYDAGAQAR